MTEVELRDYFAGLAMQTLLKKMPIAFTTHADARWFQAATKEAYAIADLMLEVRE